MSKHFANSPVFQMVDRREPKYGGRGWAYKCRDCDFETSVQTGGNAGMNQQAIERDAHRIAVMREAGFEPSRISYSAAAFAAAEDLR